MARGWRVLDATSFEGDIGFARGQVILTDASGTRRVPAAEVAIVLIGSGALLKPSVMHCSAKYDIALLMADWRGVPVCGIYPWADHSRVAARHLAQAEMSIPRRKNAWMHIVKAKIRGQAATLRSTDVRGATHLLDIAARVRSGDPTNCEGQAARYYWNRLFPAEFVFVRDQDSGDDHNAMLNYGYMVLRGHGVRATLSAGLSPPLGIFHRGRSNYFNLVDDLIEPFRGAVDHVVAGMEASATLEDPEVRHALVDAASQPFTDEGYRIPAVLEDLAQQFGRYVEGELDRLDVPAWSGPKNPIEVCVDGEG